MLAERLKTTREKLGMTQSDVCKASGVSKAYLSSLESGNQKEPSYTKLLALAKALSTSPEYLFGEVDSHPSRTCKTCMFFQRSTNERQPDHGLCHRFPPPHAGKTFPIMTINDFCGEWQKR